MSFESEREALQYRVYFRRAAESIWRWDPFDHEESARSWHKTIVQQAQKGERPWCCSYLIDMHAECKVLERWSLDPTLPDIDFDMIDFVTALQG